MKVCFHGFQENTARKCSSIRKDYLRFSDNLPKNFPAKFTMQNYAVLP